eukprot:COSAG06_NODE_1402_length_9571_cov_8.528294_3_plen_53_part_00
MYICFVGRYLSAGMMGSIIQGTTSWTSKYLSERFGARQMQIYSNGAFQSRFL